MSVHEPKEIVMSTSKFEKFLPYTGILAGLLFVGGAVLPKVPTKFGDPNAVALLNAHDVRTGIGAICSGLFCVAMLFFAAALRRALRSGEGGESTYSGVAYAGAILVAASQAAVAWFSLTAIESAHHHDKQVVDTLSALGINSWIPWVAASAAMFLAAGLGGVRNAVLPRWLGIVTVVLGVACLLGPAGVAVYFATPFWLIVTGVVLGRRQQAEEPTRSHAMASA
jgi:hypothetical protein